MIEVRDLVKEFGSTRAVAGVTFTVRAGEIMGLLGPNGSGKTTIMRVLTGFFPPTSGSVAIGGVAIDDDPLGARQRIGYLPENVVLYPELTVARFLAFCAEVKGVRKGELRVRVDEVIERCGLVEVAGKLIGKLSKGYRQRVGIAQAIVHRPQVLILDEPTVGLDPRQVIEIRELVRSLGGATTVLLSTHILPEISMTCNRVMIIDYGRIIAEDTPEGLSRRLRGSDETRVRVAGPNREVVEAVRVLPQVETLRQESVEADVVTMVVCASDGDAMRRSLAAMVVQRGWGLLELRPLPMSLEDLFVRVVREEREVAQ